MGTTSDVRCYDWFCYDGCPTNCMASQRYTGNTAISANVHRFSLVVEGWIHDAANKPGPAVRDTALENFHRSAHWREANRQAVDYLVRRAAEGSWSSPRRRTWLTSTGGTTAATGEPAFLA